MANESLMQALEGADPFDAPIPGESLTSNPDVRAPYERPPQFVKEEEAIEEIFLSITEEDRLDELLDLMRMGTPLEDIAQVVLFSGFTQGKWTPDLMLLLIEPTIYLLAFLANYAEIPAEIYPEGDEGISEEAAEILAQFEGGVSLGDSVEVGGSLLQRPESVPASLLDNFSGKQTEQEVV